MGGGSLGLAEGGAQLGGGLLDVARLLLDGSDALGRTGRLQGGSLAQQVLEDLIRLHILLSLEVSSRRLVLLRISWSYE